MSPRQNPNSPLKNPQYPKASIQLRKKGRVVLNVLVRKNGSVATAAIATSSGFPRLDRQALNGVLSWHLQPSTLEGKPVCAMAQFGIDFRLDVHVKEGKIIREPCI